MKFVLAFILVFFSIKSFAHDNHYTQVNIPLVQYKALSNYILKNPMTT